MKRETVKTLVLALLVIVSLYLTWNIWTFQPSLDPIENMKYLESKPLTEEEREIGEVVKPQQVFYHGGDSHYNADSKADDIWESLAKWKLEDSRDVSNSKTFSSKTKFLNFVSGLDGQKKLELIFSQTIPVETFQSILDWNSKTVKNQAFDRIVVPFDRVKTPKLYFISYKNQKVLEVNLNNDITQLSGKYFSSLNEYDRYFTWQVNKDCIVMLPEKNPLFSRQSFSMGTFSADKFKQALFNNPSYVTSGASGSQTVYTDGQRRMVYDSDRGSMRFTDNNGLKRTEAGTGLSKIMTQSIDYLNSRGGWTDTDEYVFFSHTKDLEITLRMTLNGMPIFASFEPPLLKTTITQNWGSTDVLSYEHPIFFRNYDSNPEPVKIESGAELIEMLEASRGELRKDNLFRVFPAYELSRSTEDLIVVAEPAWYAETKSGNYLMIQDPRILGGGSQNGLE
ncbi:hypothetical protein CEF21_01385 [Bacillus sp. FJAT-42376]|uniref:YycH family regulatory protein n=1 Tax=Bacillus sp. FJAT-42376 TaxID=2014076 RepID=UPI000F50D337|nr:two-component system activity regulator YycH [Bacillus sp. FJAT-42376]AZB41101.1 hypothetical protein CEF21_01385 [Bacillus sp. FJAT-42376]